MWFLDPSGVDLSVAQDRTPSLWVPLWPPFPLRELALTMPTVCLGLVHTALNAFTSGVYSLSAAETRKLVDLYTELQNTLLEMQVDCPSI